MLNFIFIFWILKSYNMLVFIFFYLSLVLIISGRFTFIIFELLMYMVKIACVLSNFYSTHRFQWVSKVGYVNIHNGQLTILWGIDCQKKMLSSLTIWGIEEGYCCCWVTSVVSDSVRPHRGQSARLPVPGILQARTLEWVAISFSNAWKWKVKVKSLSRVRLERPHGLQPTRLFRPWDFPGKSTGVGCHCLLGSYFKLWL